MLNKRVVRRKSLLLVLSCPIIIGIIHVATTHHDRNIIIFSRSDALGKSSFVENIHGLAQSIMTGSSFEPAARLRATSARLSSLNGAIL